MYSSRPSMFQPSIKSVKCSILLSKKSRCVSKILLEVQLKLHPRALVNFPMRLFPNPTVIGLCWARMSGHGCNSVISLKPRSIDDNDDRFADSSKTRGSMDVMTLWCKTSVSSRCRLVNTPSCRRQNNQHCRIVAVLNS